MTAPLLEFTGVNAYYGSAHILQGVDLSVRSGERVAVVGRNGVGKTTIVNTLLGIAALRGGSVHMRGEPLLKLAGHTGAMHGIAVVPQGRMILPNLSTRRRISNSARRFGGRGNGRSTGFTASSRCWPNAAARQGRPFPAGSSRCSRSAAL